MKERRTLIDFSKHQLIVTEHPNIHIFDLRLDDREYFHRVTFINAHGILAVKGDFGNWIFCREFHPDADGYVSDGYWDEKLTIGSVQKPNLYDTEITLELIKEFEESFQDSYDREMTEEELDWVETLKYNSDDEVSYTHTAYRDKPSYIDYEDVPYGEVRHRWLPVIYDAFEEMCKRYKENPETIIKQQLL